MFSKFEFLVVLSLAVFTSAAFISRDSDSDSSEEERKCPASVECKVHGALLAIPDNCSQFCHCSHGKGILKDCPSGLHWNVRLTTCDWPNNANCQVTTTTTRTTTTRRTTTKRPTRTPRPTRTTTTTTTEEPTQTPEPTTEPPTEEPTEEPTEAPTETPTEEPTEAPTEEPTEAPTEEPTEAPTEAPEEPDFDCSEKSCGYYAVRNSANEYVHCSEGQGVVHTCPNNLEFNPSLSTCDYPSAASNEE